MTDEIIKERMLRSLKEKINEHWGYSDLLQKMFLTDLNGACIPEEFAEDIMLDIMDKFYFFYAAIRNETNKHIDVYVSPSYKDSTTTLMILGDRVLYIEDNKAWNFWFESEDAMKDEMYSIYLEILSKMEESCLRNGLKQQNR